MGGSLSIIPTNYRLPWEHDSLEGRPRPRPARSIEGRGVTTENIPAAQRALFGVPALILLAWS